MLCIRGKQRNGEGENLFSLSPFSCFHYARGEVDWLCTGFNVSVHKINGRGKPLPYGIRFPMIRSVISGQSMAAPTVFVSACFARKCVRSIRQLLRENGCRGEPLAAGYRGRAAPCFVRSFTLRTERHLCCKSTTSRKRCPEDVSSFAEYRGYISPCSGQFIATSSITRA